MEQGCNTQAGLVLLATLVAIQIARELNTDQLQLLSAFFEVLGDNLALLATPSPACPGSFGNKKDAEG